MKSAALFGVEMASFVAVFAVCFIFCKSSVGHGSSNGNNSARNVTDLAVDPSGYLIFCPCMGRFGNQAEHYLGALAFAKALNRTLLLPPFRTYKNVRFDEWFEVEPVKNYHRVMVAEDFMGLLADKVWPEGKRVGFCFSRSGACNMKEGNPFGPFWDGLGVDFDKIHPYDTSFHQADLWNERFPADRYPVIALRGAPASFPMAEEHRQLHRHLVWSASISEKVAAILQELFDGREYVGIHLRNNVDWDNACGHGVGRDSYMSSYQCLGWDGQKGVVTADMCLPSEKEVLRATRAAILKSKARFVYVATDRNPMLKQLSEHLRDLNVDVVHHDPHLPQVDLAILAKSAYFVGNCVSSFTSFVVRERIFQNPAWRPFSFFGQDDEE